MRLALLVATTTALAARIASAVSQNLTYNALQLASASPCSLDCLIPAVQKTNCQLTDYDCVCASPGLVDTVAKCTLSTCGLYDSFNLSKVNANICQPEPASRTWLVRRIDISTQVISRITVLSRLASRLWMQHRWMPDDWVMAVASLIEIPCFYYRTVLENHGLGDHVWMLEYSDIKILLRATWAAELFYITLNGMVKISILLSFLNIFPNKIFRRVCWFMLVFCLTSSTTFIITTIFECKPIKFAWDKTIMNGKCVNFNAVVWAHAAINIGQELIILLLPMRELWKLKLNRLKKTGLVMLFSLGGFVVITAIIRTHSLKKFGLTSDPTWDNTDGIIWSVLEISIAMTCASLPALRGPFMKITAPLWPTTIHSTTGNSRSKPLSSNNEQNLSNQARDPKWPQGGRQGYVMKETEVVVDCRDTTELLEVPSETVAKRRDMSRVLVSPFEFQEGDKRSETRSDDADRSEKGLSRWTSRSLRRGG